MKTAINPDLSKLDNETLVSVLGRDNTPEERKKLLAELDQRVLKLITEGPKKFIELAGRFGGYSLCMRAIDASTQRLRKAGQIKSEDRTWRRV